MTETENVATYSRIRPYNPAINEDKKLTCRAVGGNKILNQNGANEDTYNFTKVFDMSDDTDTVFEESMKPLLDFKILQGITSIFIVYGQSGSGKSFTLIGEQGYLGVLPMSLQYLLDQDVVESIHVSSIEAYGINQAKIGFYDLVAQLKLRQELESQKKVYDAYSCKDNPRLNPGNAESLPVTKDINQAKIGFYDLVTQLKLRQELESQKKVYDAYSCKDNPRLNPGNAESLPVTKENCLEVITKLQDVSHMAPTLKNPHSSRGHTVYFNRVKMKDLEDVYFICIDLAGSEGQTALGTKEEFVEGLQLAMSKGKLHLNKKQMKSLDQMYKTRSLEAGCINNGLTQLQSIFGELIRKKISKSQGLGLRKILSQFINLKTAYAIMFTMSASANNNKVTRATLNFAKQTQLVKVDTQKAKKKIDKDKIIKELEEVIKQFKEEMKEKNKKDKIIKELEEVIKQLKEEMKEKNLTIIDLRKQLKAGGGGGGGASAGGDALADLLSDADNAESTEQKDMDSLDLPSTEMQRLDSKAIERFDLIVQQINELQVEEAKWTVADEHVITSGGNMTEDQMRTIFDEFDEDKGGTIDAEELQKALQKMGHNMSMEEVHDLIDTIDQNNDGVVDFSEFKVLCGQSWFKDAYENRLRAAMQRMMSTMSVEEDDVKSDNEDDYEFVNEQEVANGANDAEQMKEIERLQKKVQELLQQQKEQKENYEKQIAASQENETVKELQARLSALETENNELKIRQNMSGGDSTELEQLQQKVTQLESENDELKRENERLQQDGGASPKDTDGNESDAQTKQEVDALKTELESLKSQVQVVMAAKGGYAEDSTMFLIKDKMAARWCWTVRPWHLHAIAAILVFWQFVDIIVHAAVNMVEGLRVSGNVLLMFFVAIAIGLNVASIRKNKYDLRASVALCGLGWLLYFVLFMAWIPERTSTGFAFVAFLLISTFLAGMFGVLCFVFKPN
eukprot:CAMPEP_0197077116 /NCGR_PEP_ID=MMETSP1384-20130603/212455_1 /TAXON_ID=29189 /ORGANISM="Ammonia sp." /LENGTH=965 /DNA_ID=CAMNT_0042515975 /DNA_START=26 /DNA_END=2924 /DNA_ORIENTATION=-